MMLMIMTLLFGKTVLLTEVPINISKNEAIILETESFKAINNGAHILIDVSGMIENINNKKITELRNEVKNLFKDMNLSVELIGKKSNVNLSFSGNTSINGEKVFLILSPDQKYVDSVSWSSIKVLSSKNLTGVYVFWKNYSK